MFLIKAILSVLLLWLGFYLLVVANSLGKQLDGVALGVASGFLLIATVPWIVSGKGINQRACGLIGIAVTLVTLVQVKSEIVEHVAYPANCGNALCRFGNFLHELGGNYATATLWLLIAIFFFSVSLFMIKRSKNQPFFKVTFWDR
jgi:hypothetical protein